MHGPDEIINNIILERNWEGKWIKLHFFKKRQNFPTLHPIFWEGEGGRAPGKDIVYTILLFGMNIYHITLLLYIIVVACYSIIFIEICMKQTKQKQKMNINFSTLMSFRWNNCIFVNCQWTNRIHNFRLNKMWKEIFTAQLQFKLDKVATLTLEPYTYRIIQIEHWTEIIVSNFNKQYELI